MSTFPEPFELLLLFSDKKKNIHFSYLPLSTGVATAYTIAMEELEETAKQLKTSDTIDSISDRLRELAKEVTREVDKVHHRADSSSDTDGDEAETAHTQDPHLPPSVAALLEQAKHTVDIVAHFSARVQDLRKTFDPYIDQMSLSERRMLYNYI